MNFRSEDELTSRFEEVKNTGIELQFVSLDKLLFFQVYYSAKVTLTVTLTWETARCLKIENLGSLALSQVSAPCCTGWIKKF